MKPRITPWLLVLLACSQAKDGAVPDATRCKFSDVTVVPSGPVALFSLADAPSVPFPFDVFTRKDPASPTGRFVILPEPAGVLLDGPMAQVEGLLDVRAFVEGMDGFSVFGPILFGFSAPIDPGVTVSDPSNASKHISFLRFTQSGACEVEPAFVYGFERLEDPKGLLVVRPYLPLLPATRYAVVVKRGLAAKDGTPFEPHPDFARLAAGEQVQGALAEAARDILKPLWACLKDLCPTDILVATVFTTGDPGAILRGIQEDIISRKPSPILDLDASGRPKGYPPAELLSMDPGFASFDLSESSIGVRGHFTVRDYRGPDHDIAYKGVGPISSTRDLNVPFVLLLPKQGPGPFPLVVMGHGHSGRKERIGYIAKRFGEAGLALAAIDAIGHGDLKDEGVFLTPDMHMVRGSFLQSDVNLLAFLVALRGLSDLDVWPPHGPDGKPDLDVGAMGYIGESLGSLMGGVVTALDTSVRAVVLNVGGGGLSNAGQDTVEGVIGANDPMVLWALRAVLQGLLDPFDPIAFATGLAAPLAQGRRPVLMQSVVGDAAFDGAPTEDLARALGLTYVCPCPIEVPFLPTVKGPQSVSGLVYWANAKHGFLFAEEEDPAASDAVRRQAATFLKTALLTGSGLVVPEGRQMP